MPIIEKLGHRKFGLDKPLDSLSVKTATKQSINIDDSTSVEKENRRKAMETIYDIIYLKAKPYLDTRQNEIHIQISYDFAKQLLTYYPEAKREIVLPAILLHDIGWKMVPEEKQLEAFGPAIKDKKTQRFHEVEGARIADEILTSLNYNEKLKKEIVTIIDGHDTRLKGLSLNDKLVKDSDKLCRFTPTGVNIDHTRFKLPRKSYLDWITPMIENWLFTPEAKDMAHIALLEAKSEIVLKR